MPASPRGISQSRTVIGVDGCRAGWAIVAFDIETTSVSVSIWPDFERFHAGPGALAAAIMVDMPIGLSEDGARACERLARDRLRPLRHSSVFPTPSRAMLEAASYEDANAIGRASPRGKGLPKQAWFLMPKIRELDRFMTPDRQAQIGEAHPEVAFSRLNGGAPCAYPKRSADGRRERIRLLARAGLPDPEAMAQTAMKSAAASAGRGGVAVDDILDAAALALSAAARLAGNAVRLTDEARDRLGRVMEIWG